MLPKQDWAAQVSAQHPQLAYLLAPARSWCAACRVLGAGHCAGREGVLAYDLPLPALAPALKLPLLLCSRSVEVD